MTQPNRFVVLDKRIRCAGDESLCMTSSRHQSNDMRRSTKQSPQKAL
jgi:hypothetical protein